MKQYETAQGDTWDLIAKREYGDEKKLDALMENNYNLLDYVVFPAGIMVNIPEISRDKRQGLPDWRKA